MSMKSSNDSIECRTHDFPTCSAVPQRRATLSEGKVCEMSSIVSTVVSTFRKFPCATESCNPIYRYMCRTRYKKTVRNKTQDGLFHSKLSVHSVSFIVSLNTAPL